MFGDPWWADKRLVVARLTQKPRMIKIINTLTSQERILLATSPSKKVSKQFAFGIQL
jgi:hypothetical protein